MFRIEVDDELAARLIRASREFHRLASERFNVSDISAGRSDRDLLQLEVNVELEKAVGSFEDMNARFKENACKE